MSSIWSSGATMQAGQAGGFPFASTGTAPSPGGGAAAQFQSILQSAGKQSRPAGAATAADSTSGTSGSDDSSSSDATISANDFLTLLVTEMQNQDPTADTDPNAYIDQLVQINSLEQLISINQNLSTVLGAASSDAGSSGSSSAAGAVRGSGGTNAAAAGVRNAAAAQQQSSSFHEQAGHGQAVAARHSATVRGNLSASGDKPAAHTVARALDGHARGMGHAIRDIQTRSLP